MGESRPGFGVAGCRSISVGLYVIFFGRRHRVSKLPESFTEVEISAGKKPIQKLRLLFAFFGYPPRKFTMAYPHTVLTAILDPLGECMTPEVARRVIQLRASAEANIRMRSLPGVRTRSKRAATGSTAVASTLTLRHVPGSDGTSRRARASSLRSRFRSRRPCPRRRRRRCFRSTREPSRPCPPAR